MLLSGKAPGMFGFQTRIATNGGLVSESMAKTHDFSKPQAYQLESCQIDHTFTPLMLCSQEVITVESAPDSTPLSELLKDDGSQYPSNLRFNPRDDVAIVPYSSGTTGLPKGVMLTHFNIVANIEQLW